MKPLNQNLRFGAAILLVSAMMFLVGRPAPGEETAPKADGKQKAWYEGAKIEETQPVDGLKVRAFGDRVYFGGQPKPEQFKLFADKGVKTVINLRTPEEMKGIDEKSAVEASGMKYVQVPIGKAVPKDEDIEKIMKALDSAKDAPVLLHCASSNRVGYVWSMYRATRHGLSEDAAIAEGKQAGMVAPNLVDGAKKYIEEKKGADMRKQ